MHTWLLTTCLLLACLATTNAAGQPLSAERSPEGVHVREGDRDVLFYQTKPKSLDGRFQRANYIHPLYDLEGRVITEDFPEDHRHHRGIFWAWHQLWVGDQQLGDGWATRDFDWEVRDVDVRPDEQSLTLDAHVLWSSAHLTDDEGTPVPVIDEQTRICVHAATSEYRLIDFDIRLRALMPDVRLGGSEDDKGYGGFSVRIPLPDELRFTGTGGPIEPQTEAVSAGPWLDLAASDWGVAVLTHPDNPGFPQPWILRRQRSMQNPAYPGREPVLISQEMPLRLRYRLVVHRGALEPTAIDQLHAEYGEKR